MGKEISLLVNFLDNEMGILEEYYDCVQKQQHIQNIINLDDEIMNINQQIRKHKENEEELVNLVDIKHEKLKEYINAINTIQENVQWLKKETLSDWITTINNIDDLVVDIDNDNDIKSIKNKIGKIKEKINQN